MEKEKPNHFFVKPSILAILSLKTCNNEVAELGVRLIAECAL